MLYVVIIAFLLIIINMSHSVKIYNTCIGCTQCVRACPTDGKLKLI